MSYTSDPIPADELDRLLRQNDAFAALASALLAASFVNESVPDNEQIPIDFTIRLTAGEYRQLTGEHPATRERSRREALEREVRSETDWAERTARCEACREIAQRLRAILDRSAEQDEPHTCPAARRCRRFEPKARR